MVDILTVAIISTVIAALSLTWAIFATLVPKRKELRASLQNFQQRTRDRLNQTNQTLRKVFFLMIGSAIFGAGLEYYLPTLTVYIVVFSFLAWIAIGGVIFGNPEPDEEEHMTRTEVEQLVEQRLKEEREKSSVKS